MAGLRNFHGCVRFQRTFNVVPALWLGEYDPTMIERDMALLREAHINGVRLRVHVNWDEFYTAYDRAGLMVWQDFALNLIPRR